MTTQADLRSVAVTFWELSKDSPRAERRRTEEKRKKGVGRIEGPSQFSSPKLGWC